MIIDNKGGAGTTIGMAAAAAAAPTGYTLVVNGDTAAIFEYIFANLKFDTMKDFVPVAYFASAPIVLAAHPSFAPGNVRELIELAKKEPGKINYATPGVGTPHDLAGLLFMQKAGVKFNEVAYRGNGPALADLLAGHVQIGMFTLTNVLPYVQSGKLKALAVVGDRRTPLAPDFPSMAQSGLPGARRQRALRAAGAQGHARACRHQAARSRRVCGEEAGNRRRLQEDGIRTDVDQPAGSRRPHERRT